MDDTRRARLASRILHELSDLHMRGEIKDHRVDRMISFSFIKVARDGSTARVGVSSMMDAPGHAARAVEGLNSAAGYIQTRLGKVLRVRTTPRVYFVEDHSVEEAQQIIRTIERVVGSSEDEHGHTGTEQTERP